jgi:hypothetical protein
MKNIILLFAIFIFYSCSAQETLKDPDYFLIKGEKVPQVLLVGTFHFNYPNLDAHKISKDKQVDVKSQKKQQEMLELLDYIARFKPTKIVVEAWQGSNLNDNYKKYLEGNYKLRKNETNQIGFRLAKQFNLKKLELCEASTLVNSLDYSKDSLLIRPITDSIFKDWDFRSDDPISLRYKEWYKYTTELILQLTLLESFKFLNSEKSVVRGHGAYLVGDFKLGEQRGADALALHWYSRNLRIFRNIQKIEASGDDRILVLFGAGHMGILKQQFESSPEYELVPFKSLE